VSAVRSVSNDATRVWVDGALVDGREPRDPGHRLAGPVDRVEPSLVAALGDVAQDGVADRPGARGGAEDRDARGREERLERGDDGPVVALVHALAELLRRGDRKRDLDLPLGKLARHVEAGAEEHLEHAAVVRQHPSDEPLDPRLGRELGELPFLSGDPGAAVEQTADDVERLAQRARATAQDARTTGADAEEAASDLALVLGLAVGLAPTLPVLLLYLLVRPVVAERLEAR